jgi:hypothetical protein
MAHRLQPHPSTPIAFDLSIEVEALRLEQELIELSFLLTGETERILLPPPGRLRRADGLWQHTCFEAFIKPGSAEAYREINLAPSGEWAAYDFDGYRQGMRNADLLAPAMARSGDSGELKVEAAIAGPPSTAAWHIGLSAVIEARDGTRSYWALHHPPGKPDFHHRDCFALELAPPA